MLFLQPGPAATIPYMIAGYTVIFSVMLIYIISLVVRRRNLQRTLELLQEMEKKKS
jgi:CcmD family protein